jgi:uncharacterized protein YciI
MNSKFVTFYFFKVSRERVMEVAQEHRDYWAEGSRANHTGGPFADRSGGMIIFAARNLEEAEQMAGQDPFVTKDLLEKRWVKEWVIK